MIIYGLWKYWKKKRKGHIPVDVDPVGCELGVADEVKLLVCCVGFTDDEVGVGNVGLDDCPGPFVFLWHGGSVGLVVLGGLVIRVGLGLERVVGLILLEVVIGSVVVVGLLVVTVGRVLIIVDSIDCGPLHGSSFAVP